MILLNEMECSGCGACVSICPGGCIALQCAPNGYDRPVIDAARCVDCGLCAKVCPQTGALRLNKPDACYAAVRSDTAARADSASGGIGALLGEQFLLRNPGAAICGVRWNGDAERAEYAIAREAAELEAFKGSKYVQPYADDIYRSVARLLKEGRAVLFFGLPCHVTACRKFADAMGISQDKLTCVDLLCHGVSSHAFLTEELQWLKRKYRFVRIEKLTFRSNRKNRNYHFIAEGTDRSGRKKRWDRAVGEDPYFRAFLDSLSLRESCYRCRFSCADRCGDLTIGDFLGLGKSEVSDTCGEEIRNASLVLANNEKGKQLLESAGESALLIARPFEEAVRGGPSLRKPAARPAGRDLFIKEYETKGFMAAAQVAMGKALLKSRVKHTLLRAANRLGIGTDTIVRIIRKGK